MDGARIPMVSVGAWAAASSAALLGFAGLGFVAAGGSWREFVVSRRADAVVIAAVGGLFGGLIVQRRPRNPLGWLFLLNAVSYGARNLLEQYAVYNYSGVGRSLPSAAAASFGAILPLIVAAGTLALIILLFPDGQPVSSRWRILGWTIGLTVGGALVAVSVLSWPLRGRRLLDGAPAPVGQQGHTLTAVTGLGQGVLALCALGALVALTLRYRASTGVVRQQLKWFAAGAIPSVVLIIAYHLIPGVAGGVIAMVASLPLLAGVTVAIRRYRLYDIDRLVSTTVAYLSLSALLVAIYGLSATALGQLFGSAGGGSTAAVAGSAVVVTALFDPLRRRLQHASDRYFRRRNYEATRVVGRYLDGLREHEPEPGALRDTIRLALADPGAEIALWLPYHSGYVTERGEAVDVPNPEGDVSITRVDRAGAHLGVVIHDRSARADPGSAAGALRAAAAAFDHARLAAQVLVQVAEVRAARTRILAAGDVERRRVERNLHDGAQQHLVGLGLELGRLRTQATQSGHTDLVERIEGAAWQAGAALRELRELARGLHPAILTEQGLVAAIASLAERSLTPVAIRADVDRRYAPLVETTAYYVVAEALTNVAKHAQAAKVSVVVAEDSGRLRVEVSDDGVGGARSDVESGLAGLEDRIEALGGRLVVVSPPGAGTALVAELPL